MKWSEWKKFPDPKKGEYLCAPFGPGVYELRLATDLKPLLFGKGNNVAYRMTSLLPLSAGGQGTRYNEEKRTYVARHIRQIEYRTLACLSVQESKEQERLLKQSKAFIFNEKNKN